MTKIRFNPLENFAESNMIASRLVDLLDSDGSCVSKGSLRSLDPGKSTDMRDVIIWFEDCTRHPDRVFNETGIASRGMPESDLDKYLQTVSVSVIEKHYLEPGLLSGVRLSYQEKSVSIDFESDLRHLAQELGTNPWIRNAEEPQYLEFWNSKKPLF